MEFLPFIGSANIVLAAAMIILQLRLEAKLTERIHAAELRLAALEASRT